MATKFYYRAKNKQGEYFEGEMEADEQNQVLDKLEAQGLWVIKLNKLGGENLMATASVAQPASSTQTQPPTPTAAVPDSKPLTAKTVNNAPNIVQEIIQKIFSNIGIVITLACLLMLPVVFRVQCEEPASKGPMRFKIAGTQDYSASPDYLRYNYSIEIPKGTNKADVRKIAETLQTEKMQADPKIQEVAFNFYYDGENTGEQKPVAIMQWNWNKSKDWESSFNLDSGEGKKDMLSLEQKELKEGKSVVYDMVLSNDLTIPGAESFAGKKMQELKKKWPDIKQIKIHLIYDGFDDPFMDCTLNRTETPGDQVNCAVLK